RRHTRWLVVTGVQTCALPIYLRPVLRRQVREPLERALQLLGAHLVEPPAELLENGNDGEPAIPGPKAIHLFGDDVLGRRNLLAALLRRLRRDRLEIVDVVEKHILEPADGG